ncbi:polymeric immunoglobulin receptor-like isoform X2 [Plectropomus leopardus]|uniref:polymeric immunoglobulin receptor-like isoform X2 n=1 Tax=Plectropomus leopardus TaxID=160734 RepID=UPI001C4B5426|nr:polymeric immunoglobulin receptor-like isoform X2 [Plectropomus leopardus]
MNIQHFVFFCLISALCAGNAGLVSAKPNTYAIAEGGTVSIKCTLTLSGNMKFFCKDECKAEDILIKTEDVRAQSGRFSIKYKNASSGRGILTVTITNVTKSDSGRYRCGLGKTLAPKSYRDFEVRVLDAAPLDVNSGFTRTETEGGDITYPCSDTVYGRRKFFCKEKCFKQDNVLIETDGNKTQSGRYSIEYREKSVPGLYVTIREVTKSDTGWYRCGYGRASSQDSYKRFQIIIIDASKQPTTCQTSSETNKQPAEILNILGHLLLLVVCVPGVCVMFAVFLLLVFKCTAGLNTGGNADNLNMETVICENCPEDAVYQSLDPASRDQDQTYSTPLT